MVKIYNRKIRTVLSYTALTCSSHFSLLRLLILYRYLNTFLLTKHIIAIDLIQVRHVTSAIANRMSGFY